LPRGAAPGALFEGNSIDKHCTTPTKKSPRIKMGWKKKMRALFKNRITCSAATERTREIEAAKKRPDLERGGESVHTEKHVGHFPDLPGGEITVEGSR
jgi:hypothetical protein